MSRRLIAAALVAAVPAFASALPPSPAAAQSAPERRDKVSFGPAAGAHEFTLSGSGASDRRFDDGSFGVTGSYGQYLTDRLEAGVRQSLTWVNSGDNNDFNGSTRLVLDYHFEIGNLKPFVGANIGYVYGDSVNDTGIIGPEAGVKYFVNETTFIVGQAEYQYFIDSGDDVADRFDDGSFVYSIGIGFLF